MFRASPSWPARFVNVVRRDEMADRDGQCITQSNSSCQTVSIYVQVSQPRFPRGEGEEGWMVYLHLREGDTAVQEFRSPNPLGSQQAHLLLSC